MKRFAYFGAVLGFLTMPTLSFAQGQCYSVAGNLVANCGFETGDFTSWTQGGNPGFTGVTGSPYAHSGNFGAYLGPVGSDGILMSQTLATTAGASYDLNFWLANFGGPTNDFSVQWDGVTIPGSTLINSNPFPYTEFSFSGLTALGGDTLQFSFRQDPSYWGLDDVSVVQQTSMPEPAAFAGLMLAGVAVVMGKRRTIASNSVR